MPAATDKVGLLAAFDAAYAKLDKTLASIDESSAVAHARDDETTIKGIVAHRTHWIGLFFSWYEGGIAGADVETPAPGYKWNQLKAYNAPIYAAAKDRSWADLQADFETSVTRLRAFIDGGDDAELYTAGRWPWLKTWTLGRWAEASGPAAFRSANTYIRKALREYGQS